MAIVSDTSAPVPKPSRGGAVSPRGGAKRAMWNPEWERLRVLAAGLSPLLFGDVRNFLLQPVGEAVVRGPETRVRAHLLGDQQGQPILVVLKVRSSDWMAVRHVQGALKALQARLLDESPAPVLDLTGPESVLVGNIPTAVGEHLQIAELFCGGFAGVSQAATLLHSAGLPIHTAWRLDWAQETEPFLTTQDPELRFVRNRDELAEIQPGEEFVIQTDAHRQWWIAAFAYCPVQAVAISAPCPPWSGAGRAQGLHSPDGQLLAKMADVCGAVAVPYIFIEQVANFPQHAHFKQILDLWKTAGYKAYWQGTLDLHDILPGSRRRFLQVLVHEHAPPPQPAPIESWSTAKRTSLAEAQVILPMPVELLEPLVPSPEILDLYLDPRLIPGTRVGSRAQAPALYRLRTPSQSATCFMARYGAQHELPRQLLKDKGLLGCLLKDGELIRFFGSPEISSLHAVCKPLWISASLPLNMQIVGNSISVPHSLVGLTYILRAAGLDTAGSLASRVELALQHRLRADNVTFLPAQSGWIMCNRSQIQQRLACTLPSMHLSPARFNRLGLVPVRFETAAASGDWQVDVATDPATLLQHLGISFRDPSQRPSAHALQVSALPSVDCRGRHVDRDSPARLTTVLAADASFVLAKQSALTCVQLLEVCLRVAPDMQTTCTFYTFEGQVVNAAELLPEVSLAVMEHPAAPFVPWELQEHELMELRIHSSVEGYEWQVPEDQAALFRLTFPSHLLASMGWHMRKGDSILRETPSAEEGTSAEKPPLWSTTFQLVPRSNAIISAPQFCHLQRLWVFRARLESLRQPADHGGLLVVVKIVSHAVWQGPLPSTTSLHALGEVWAAASIILKLSPSCQVRSGPYMFSPDTCIASLLSPTVKTLRVRPTGTLVLTVHPEIRGGGPKAEAKTWATAKLAAVCLQQGMDLGHATDFAETLSLKVATKRMEEALGTSNSKAWEAVKAFAAEASVPVPALNPQNAAAEARIRKARSTKRLAKVTTIRAADVALQPGHFRTMSGQEAPVLSSIKPGAEGVYLADSETAPSVLEMLHGAVVEDLAVVVLGHTCPDKSKCGGTIAFPATARRNNAALLLAGCIHQVGTSPVAPHLAANATVELPPMCVCVFEMHACEFEQEEWIRIAQAPVKVAQELFLDSGVTRAFTDPWARRHFYQGRPAQPDSADRVSFLGKVAEPDLRRLLEASGHNRVYMAPKDAQGTISDSFSVLWTGPHRQEALKASLVVPEQLGLVHTRGRYGLRVSADAFEKVHKQLRPDQPVPNRMPISFLFRLGPVPASAGPIQVQQWALQLSWRLRVLKPSGHRHWVVGSDQAPPTEVLGWSGDVVLAVPIEQSSRPRPVVHSGKVPLTSMGPHPHRDAVREPADPWLLNDPWKQAKSQDNAAPPAELDHGPAPASSSVEGKLQQQAARMSALESDVRALRDEQRTARQVDKAQFAQDMESVRQQMGCLAKDVSEQLRTSVQTLQDSQQRQQLQMQNSLEELKALFLQPHHLPRKQRKEEEGQL